MGGGSQVECFDLETLTLVAMLSTEQRTGNGASLTIWRDRIVLGVGRSLLFWELPNAESNPATIVPPLPPQCEPELRSITAVAAVGDVLAIASFDDPVIHLYQLENGIPTLFSRLISHAGGITALRSTPDARLVTGWVGTKFTSGVSRMVFWNCNVIVMVVQ